MPLLLNQTYPYLKIYDPDTGGYHEFVGGKLEIEESDPGYACVMAEAARNPSIAVYQSVATCVHCGETTASKKALEAHVKDNHFDRWLEKSDAAAAELRNVEIKAREGFPCDVCRPVQVFGDEKTLSMHVQAFHTTAPVLDDEGNERGGREAAPTTVPAAKPSKK